MSRYPSPKEMQLAKEMIDDLKREFTKKRNVSFAISAAFLLIALIFLALKLPMMAFCALLISFMLLLRGLDANGQLKVIGLRSTKTLYPRMWVLNQKPSGPPPAEASVKQ
jgi:hypothetical protein